MLGRVSNRGGHNLWEWAHVCRSSTRAPRSRRPAACLLCRPWGWRRRGRGRAGAPHVLGPQTYMRPASAQTGRSDVREQAAVGHGHRLKIDDGRLDALGRRVALLEDCRMLRVDVGEKKRCDEVEATNDYTQQGHAVNPGLPPRQHGGVGCVLRSLAADMWHVGVKLHEHAEGAPEEE